MSTTRTKRPAASYSRLEQHRATILGPRTWGVLLGDDSAAWGRYPAGYVWVGVGELRGATMIHIRLFRYLACIAPRYGYIEVYDLTTGAKATDAAPCPPEVIWEWRWR